MPFYKVNESLLGDRPPPPPLPKYDPNEEAPMWNWTRQKWNLPVDKGPKEWTRVGELPKSDDDPDWRGVVRNKISEYPLPDTYNLDDFKDKPAYFWFDTPDYADPFKKLVWSAKYFLKTGVLYGCVYYIFLGRPCTLTNNLKMLKSIIVPWWTAGIASSATVITVANVRGKKDDIWNYVAAGSVCGAIMGRKNSLRWVQCSILSIAGGITVKYNAETNGYLWPVANQRSATWGLHGQSATEGWRSGDLRFGFRGRNYGDPGRDVRKTS